MFTPISGRFSVLDFWIIFYSACVHFNVTWVTVTKPVLTVHQWAEQPSTIKCFLKQLLFFSIEFILFVRKNWKWLHLVISWSVRLLLVLPTRWPINNHRVCHAIHQLRTKFHHHHRLWSDSSSLEWLSSIISQSTRNRMGKRHFALLDMLSPLVFHTLFVRIRRRRSYHRSNRWTHCLQPAGKKTACHQPSRRLKFHHHRTSVNTRILYR